MTKKHKIHRDKYTQKNHTHSEIGPVWQNPIQRTVRTTHLSMLMTVHNFSTKYSRKIADWWHLTSPRYRLRMLRFAMKLDESFFTHLGLRSSVLVYIPNSHTQLRSFTMFSSLGLYSHNNTVTATKPVFLVYRIYSHISRPAYKPTPIPVAENVAKISDSRISR